MNNKKKIQFGLLGLVAYGFVQSFQTNLYTQRTQFILWKPQFDLTIGRLSAKVIDSNGSNKRTQELIFAQQMVNQIVKHAIHPDVDSNPPIFSLLWQDPVKNREWKVHIVGKTGVNAMACADGSIFVYRGLLKSVESVDEVAFVLSHEISHVLSRHIPNILCTSGLIGLGLTLISNLLFDSSYVTSVLYDLIFAKPKSRFHEEEADTVAIKVCHDSGFDPSRGAEFFIRLKKQNKEISSFISTHPAHQDRINNIKQSSNKLTENTNYDDQEAISKLRGKFDALKLHYAQQKLK